ncbi:hypothetical protein [Candidatus Poriferisodalis sp.]|uniref:hypothetical protein n=1 Tax=Candidatus Poriferisodalis sp. TaxID=3101277 RepID=UPI003B012E77
MPELDDGYVSHEERETAYGAFVSCARGLGAKDFVEPGQAAWPVSIFYGFVDDDAGVARRCYRWHLWRIDAWRQMHSPNAVAGQPAVSPTLSHPEFFQEMPESCLALLGGSAPDPADRNRPEADETEHRIIHC